MVRTEKRIECSWLQFDQCSSLPPSCSPLLKEVNGSIFVFQVLPRKMLDFLDAPVPFVVRFDAEL